MKSDYNSGNSINTVGNYNENSGNENNKVDFGKRQVTSNDDGNSNNNINTIGNNNKNSPNKGNEVTFGK